MENNVLMESRMLKNLTFSHDLVMKVKGIRDRADGLLMEMMEDELLQRQP